MRRLITPLVVVCCLLTATARAADLGQEYVLSLTEENDLFHYPTTDKHYTQGAYVGLMWPDEKSPWPMIPLNWLPDFGMQDLIHKYGLRAGQALYTPTDLKANYLIKNDRPYAGWLFASMVRDDRGLSFGNVPTVDHCELQLGVVGPDSLAAREQVWFHHVVGSADPHGWRFQLANEPGFDFIADRKLLLWDTGRDRALEAQFVPHAGISLGNIQTSAEAGTELRIGHNIDNEFARSVKPATGGFFFCGVNGRVVGYDEFLDGEVFRGSPSVAKEPGVFEADGGLVFNIWQTQISYTYNYISKEFKEQHGYDGYGSINVTCWF